MRFRTGSLRHTVVAGAEGGRETLVTVPLNVSILTTVPKTEPVASRHQPGLLRATSRALASPTRNVTAISEALMPSIPSTCCPSWDLTGGVRVDRFDATVDQSLPVTPLAKSQAGRRHAELARRAGVQAGGRWKHLLRLRHVVQSIRRDPCAQRGHARPHPPEENRTFEVGTKWDLFARKLSLRASVFRTDKDQRPRNCPNATLMVLSGSQRVNGFQIQANGYITSRWEILASYAYLDGKVIASRFFPALGGRATGQRSPKHFQHLEHLRPALAPERLAEARILWTAALPAPPRRLIPSPVW